MNRNADREVLGFLKNITGRYLRRMELEDIFGYEQGYAMDENQHIIGLDLSSCELRGGEAISELNILSHLDLSDNQLSNIRFVGNLHHLTHLNLTRNRITDITPLESLKQLERLYLNANPVSSYSPLKNLKNLTHLYLNTNIIDDFSFLVDLPNLKCLNLNGCKLKNIEFLKGMKELTHLYLKDNQIPRIVGLKDLRNLVYLDLRNNQISFLPPEIIDLDIDIYWTDTDKPGILLKNNAIDPPPIEILTRGSQAVKVYLKSLFGENQALNEVKVLLVGDGGSGKTSLVRRICNEGFSWDEPETHGINIKPWEIRSEGEFIKIHFWDFGGQEIMHATHQFFLSLRSLYILVLDGRREEKIEYWLKHTESFGGDSPVLVALNKIDNNPLYDVNRRFLQAKYKNIIGFFPISCAKGIGIDNFCENLSAALKKVEMCKIKWSANWLVVKTHLENMEENFINYKEYRTLCDHENITEAEAQNTLVELLHDLGVVLHFKDLDLIDTHVLQPKWVTQAVYKIINSIKIKNAGGILKIYWLEEILLKKVEEDFYYPPEKYKYIIELMIKFELCFEIDKETVLIPDLLGIQEPPFEFDYEAALRLIVRYKDFLPGVVIPRMIVKMHRDIKNHWQWLTGVVLESQSFQATAVIKSDNAAHEINIWVAGAWKQNYLPVIRHILKSINDRFEKLAVDERIPLHDEPFVTVSIAHLLQLRELQQSSVIPEGARKPYNVYELLEGIETRDIKKNNEIVYIDRIPVLERNTRNKIRSRVENLKEENPDNSKKGNPSKLKKWLII